MSGVEKSWGLLLRAAALCSALLFAGVAHAAAEFTETPFFAKAVAAKELPPVVERVPLSPRVIDMRALGKTPGKHGGSLKLLMGDQRDIRMMTIYGYTRLMTYNEKLEIVPDVLEKLDVEDGRIFTLHLRKGHRWSDGHPFTAEDFRYYWEDVANNKRLSASGPPLALVPGGKAPKFEIIDQETVRYTWETPNPLFVPALADAQPTYIYMPSHYLRQFHQKYAKPDDLAALVKASRLRDWGAMHERMARQYRPENPDLPTLDAWRNRTTPPAEQFLFERNPYYHRVDSEGRQLPYIDSVRLSLGSTALIPAKVGGGESDLQARYLRFDNYTFLKDAEKRNGQKVRLWDRSQGAYVAIYPNLNTTDETFRTLMRDVRFRRAFSLGINRHDINNVIFFGLGREAQNTVLPESPLYKEAYDKAYTRYDPAEANRLLDEIGLTKRDLEGTRLLPDGRKLEILIESSGDSTEETDVLELLHSDFEKLGIRILNRSLQLDILRKRIRSGQTVMSVSIGIDNAVPTSENPPDALAPTEESQFQWSMWGQYVETNGMTGQKIDMPEVAELDRLRREWRQSKTSEERRAIWEKMLTINADQLFSIGIVNDVPQPVVVTNRLRNVPEKGLYGFQPSAFFGIYMPDTFWFADAAAN
ncbi:MAG: ABC transporter substrate-binding protein [Beijerinckiaceae bacterium]|nr:ABC transporter substrate-binding protein [Beijerinckiaceae bacterium]